MCHPLVLFLSDNSGFEPKNAGIVAGDKIRIHAIHLAARLVHYHPHPFRMAGEFRSIHTLNGGDTIGEISFQLRT